MKHRNFIYWTCTALGIYVVFNLIIWHTGTKYVTASQSCSGGDLTRMGYIRDSMMCRQREDDLPSRHLELRDYHGQKVDLLTIGDSFSNGGGQGRNSFYQDYIATLSGVKVLNYPEYKGLDKISTVAMLNNNGYLDRLKPKYVLIEYAEKIISGESPENIKLDKYVSETELNKYEPVIFYQKPQQAETPVLKLDFFSEANFKYARNSLFYRFSFRAPGSPVYRVKLNRDFFTVKDPDILLFYKDDLGNMKKVNQALIVGLNNKLNELSDRLSAKGIKLCFMICVDKYDLYSGYILNNRFPRNKVFETLDALDKRYLFINTKKILLNELAKGEKDIFYADDTHWSWKASEATFKSVSFK